MRLRQIALAARDLAATSETLARVLGLEIAFHDPGVATFGLRNALLPVGDAFLEVVSPERAGTTAGRFLERRGGDAGYMVILQVDDLAAQRERLDALGVRVVWEAHLDDAATLHLHPRDVGGAIVSLDAMRPPESWRWAGPRWRECVRTDVTRALRGAELVARDGAALAARWAQVLGREAVAAGDAAWRIALDGDTRLTFRSAPSAQEPALDAVELVLADPERFRSAARGCGVLEPDGSARIGGVRFLARGA